MRRTVAILGGAGAALALLLLMGQAGGFPSRPRFQAIGVGAAPITQRGSITGSDADGLLLRTPNDSSLLLDSSGAIFELHDAAARISANRGDTDFNVPTLKVGEAAFTGEDLLPGDSVLVSKSADTSRASTVAPAADPHLQVTNLPAGHYMIEAFLLMDDGAGAGGMRWVITAPVNAFLNGVSRCNTTNAAAVAFGTTNITCAAPANNVYFFQGSGTTDDAMTTGTISIDWAQNATDATATTLTDESWLKVTRLK